MASNHVFLFLALVLISTIVGATVILIIKTNNSRKNKLYKIKNKRKEDTKDDDRI